jgi:hypothetical protein
MYEYKADPGRFFSEHFRFLLQVIILSVLHTHLLFGTGTIDPFAAEVPKDLILYLPKWK